MKSKSGFKNWNKDKESKMKLNRKNKGIVSIVLFAITFMINMLGSSGFINGLNQKDISDKFNTLITPAGFTFSIWGIIYLLLFILLLIVFLKRDEKYYVSIINQTTYLFWFSCAFNALWIIAFSYELIGLSVVVILGLCFSLLLILKKLVAINKNGYFLAPLVFGIYSGWVFIASFVNIALFLNYLNLSFGNLSIERIYVVLLIIAVSLAMLLKNYHKNAIFNLPIAWGFFGILKALELKGIDKPIFNVLFVGIILLVLKSAFDFYRNNYSIIPNNKRG